jgi:hypothetical protein
MASRKPLIDTDGDVRELTAVDMAKFKPAAEVLPLSPLERNWACAARRRHRPKNALPFGCRERWWSNFARVARAGRPEWTQPCASG